MPKEISFDQLKHRLETENSQPEIEIHSVDLSIYIAYLREQECLTPLADDKHITRFPSQYAVQRKLAECGIKQATLIHRSAYSEMVGLAAEGASATELRQVIKF